MIETEMIRARCIELIAAVKQVPPESIRQNSSFEELGLDSLDKTSLAFDVEEAFHISIPDSAFSTIDGVQAMVAGVEQELKRRVATGTSA